MSISFGPVSLFEEMPCSAGVPEVIRALLDR